MPGLNFVEKLSTFEKLHSDVDGVFRLENSVQLHDVLVVELSH